MPEMNSIREKILNLSTEKNMILWELDSDLVSRYMEEDDRKEARERVRNLQKQIIKLKRAAR